jgi:hypothetical protein
MTSHRPELPEDLRLRAAERAHAAHAEAVATSFAPLVQMGSDMLKAVAFINGGAAAATLLFVAKAMQDHRGMALALVLPLTCFGFGLSVAGFATGWSYFSQSQYALALGARERIWAEPYLADTEASRAAARQGDRFRGLAVAAVLVSVASAVGGFALAGAIMWLNLR